MILGEIGPAVRAFFAACIIIKALLFFYPYTHVAAEAALPVM